MCNNRPVAKFLVELFCKNPQAIFSFTNLHPVEVHREPLAHHRRRRALPHGVRVVGTPLPFIGLQLEEVFQHFVLVVDGEVLVGLAGSKMEIVV